MSNIDAVRASMEAYRGQDIETATRLLADDFSFTSSQDDRIDKSAVSRTLLPHRGSVHRLGNRCDRPGEQRQRLPALRVRVEDW